MLRSRQPAISTTPFPSISRASMIVSGSTLGVLWKRRSSLIRASFYLFFPLLKTKHYFQLLLCHGENYKLFFFLMMPWLLSCTSFIWDKASWVYKANHKSSLVKVRPHASRLNRVRNPEWGLWILPSLSPLWTVVSGTVLNSPSPNGSASRLLESFPRANVSSMHVIRVAPPGTYFLSVFSSLALSEQLLSLYRARYWGYGMSYSPSYFK